MSDTPLNRADKEQEFSFIIDTAELLDADNGRLFNKLAQRGKSGDPNTIDKDDLTAALSLDDRKREYGRCFLTNTERRSVSYMLNHWDDEKLKVIRDDLKSYDSKGNEFGHQGFADITRNSVDRALALFAQPIPQIAGKKDLPPAPQRHAPDLRDPKQLSEQLRRQNERDELLRPMQSDKKETRPQLQSKDTLRTADERAGTKPTGKTTSNVEHSTKVADGRPREAEILKNTQDYLSGKKKGNEEDSEFRPYIGESDVAREEMRRRQIFAMTPMPDRQEQLRQEQLAMAERQRQHHHDAPIERPQPEYTIRDGVHDTLGVLNGLSRAAMPFLMWDLAKDYADNGGRGNYRGGSYFRPPLPFLYNRQPFYGQNFFGNRNFYGPQSGYFPMQFRGNMYPSDSDTEFSHAGPDGLTFFNSRQRVPGPYYRDNRGRHPGDYYDDRRFRGDYFDDRRFRGDYFDDRYTTQDGIHDTLGALNSLSRMALPFLQWDLAKQQARNQREFYQNRYRRY